MPGVAAVVPVERGGQTVGQAGTAVENKIEHCTGRNNRTENAIDIERWEEKE